MKPALLLVDVQNDSLEREGLNPEAARLILFLESLLPSARIGCRSSIPRRL
jgi:nicotinamidase-related amidase